MKRNGFTLGKDQYPTTPSIIGWLVLECVSYLGVGFNILFYLPSASAVVKDTTYLGNLTDASGADVAGSADKKVFDMAGDGGRITIVSAYSSDGPLSFDGSIRRNAYNTPAVALPLYPQKTIKISKSTGTIYYTGKVGAFGTGAAGAFTPLPGIYCLSVANRVTINQDNEANKTLEGNYNNNSNDRRRGTEVTAASPEDYDTTF